MITKTRRIGALLASTLGALLLVGLLATPAFAWDHKQDQWYDCIPGEGHYFEIFLENAHPGNGHTGTYAVWYMLDGQKTTVESGPIADDKITVTFTLAESDFPPGVTEFWVSSTVKWSNGEITEHESRFYLDRPCKPKDTTTTTKVPPTSKETTTTAPPTTAPPTSKETTTTAPVTTETTMAPSTTVVEVSGTEAPPPSGGLPFTGANSLPMLLAALALVAGGGAAVWMTRYRARHASR